MVGAVRRAGSAPLQAALTIDSLRVVAGSRVLLDGVSGALLAGRVTGWIGPNGSGKTTLMRAALGLVRPRGTEPRRVGGAVRLNGADVGGVREGALAQRMIYVPQRGAALAGFTVAEAVAMGGYAAGRVSAGSAAVAEALAAVELPAADWALRDCGTLSGGERQRVLLARATMQRRGCSDGAPVMLCDEPTAALDPRHALGAMRMLRGWAEAGSAVAVVLHDLRAAARWCDTLWLLDGGRLVAAGAPAAVLTAERLEATYGLESGDLAVW